MAGSTTNISIRMDSNLKAQADAFFGELGMNLSTAFNIFVRQSRYTKEFIDKTLFVYYTLKVKTLETKIIDNKKHV